MKQLHKILIFHRFMHGLVAGSSLLAIGAAIATLEPLADSREEGR